MDSIIGLHNWLEFKTDGGAAMIDKLNSEVDRKTQQAVEKAKLDGTPLEGPYQRVLQPMSCGGIWSGAPIYVHRPVWPSYVLGIGSFGLFLAGAVQVGLFAATFSILVMFLWYDLYSGVLHVVLDEPLNIYAPVIGQPALEFQWHHFIPTDIVRKDFSDVVGDLNTVSSILAVIHVFWSTGMAGPYALAPWNPTAATLAGMKLFFAWYGQASHRMAHNPKISQMPFAMRLQKLGLMISVKDHKAHHQPPHEEDYCLIGVMNPVIDAMRAVTTNRHVWLGFFLFVTIFDIAILASGCNLLCNMALAHN